MTLDTRIPAADLLAHIDASAGCSIKDSFSDLDLAPYDFEILFEAQWIVGVDLRADNTAAWDRVLDADAFAQWEHAWHGRDGPVGVLRSELLDDDAIVIAAARVNDEIVGGAMFNRSGDVVGVSNMFGKSPWRGALAFCHRHLPDATVVGYESGAALAAAREVGFETAGALRVWRR